jgi:hypothetical protein
MGIHLRWGNERKSVLLLEFERHWLWEDLHTLAPEYLAMMESVPHCVHLIFEAIEGHTQVPGLALWHMPQLFKITHPREGLNLIVGTGVYTLVARRLIEATASLGWQGIIQRFTFIETRDAALSLIAQHEMAHHKDGAFPADVDSAKGRKHTPPLTLPSACANVRCSPGSDALPL